MVDDRFCTGCGAPVAEGQRTELVEQVPAGQWAGDDPVWAPTGSVPVVAPPAPPPPPPPSPVTRVQAVTPATAPIPMVPLVVHRPGFRPTPIAVLGVVAGVLLLVSMFTTVVQVTSSAPIDPGDDVPASFRLGVWIADDLGSNLSVGGLIAAVLMAMGGVAAAFGWRWGAGLVGGGGLAATGVAALTIGLAQFPIDAAHEFAAIPAETAFTLTITKALGYWLLVAAGALGIVAFFVSTNDAFGDRFGGFNPFIAAIGALAVLVAAVGPMLPESPALFSDNWYVIDEPGQPPAMLVAMRLVQLALFAIGGIVGFLVVRPWGIGVVAGAVLPSIWLGISSAFEVGTSPVGPGFRNPGAVETTLHSVTVVGLGTTLALVVLASIVAYERSTRA